MTRSSKKEPTSSRNYVPSTAAEKEEAFRLAAQLLREAKKTPQLERPKNK